MKRNAVIQEALGFDDVLLVPQETNIKPLEVSTRTRLTRTIELGIPLISAGHDNVTESPMAIALAQLGGLGVIHGNMPLGKQVEEVLRVKRAEGNFIANPITIAPEASVAEALDLMTTYKVSCLPVIEQPSKKVVGIITARDIRFFEDDAKPVAELMTKDVVTVASNIQTAEAKKMLHRHRIEKLVMVDDLGHCTGLMTVRNMQQLELFPQATRDTQGRLRVGAAVSTGKDAFDRTAAMVDAGLDVVFIDVAHAHTRDAIGTVSRIRQQRSSTVQIIAGNVATADAARSLVDAGADAVKIGIGTGVPQFTAILNVAEQCAMMDIPAIVDGGIKDAATLAKALGAGAEAAVIDWLFAGTDEAPGQVFYHGDHAYKKPAAGASLRLKQDPYLLDDGAADTSIPYRGSVANVVRHLTDGLKTAMAYSGSKDVKALIDNAEFVRIK